MVSSHVRIEWHHVEDRAWWDALRGYPFATASLATEGNADDRWFLRLLLLGVAVIGIALIPMASRGLTVVDEERIEAQNNTICRVKNRE